MCRRLLLVEDTIDLALAIADLFRMEGFEVIVENRAEQALLRASREQFDVVITDLVMPGMDGTELALSLRKNQHYNNVPVIVFSARNLDEAALKVLHDGGVDMVLNKSCEIDYLIDTVIRLIGKRSER